MRAWMVTDFATPHTITQVPDPVAGPGQVLISTGACGLNFADLLMAKGTYQDTPNLPFSLGMEVAGTVISTGAGVEGFAPGDRVAGFAGSGGLAEQIVMDAARLGHLSDAMTDVTAAGFQVAYGTSHLALTRRARLQKGETLLVLGAAGGVGLTAVEIGKALGARVIAVARGGAKLEVARRAGADHTIDASEDLTTTLRDLGGVDVIYDPVGGALAASAMRALRPEGRMVVIGFASGDVTPLRANHMLVKNIDVIGFYWGGYLKVNPAALTESMDALMHMQAAGRLAPHISHTLPFERADEGLAMLENRTSTGKIVITF